MARLYDGESGYEASSHRRRQSHGRGNLLSEYEIHCSHRFTSLHDFKRICNDFYTDLMEGDVEGDLQYLGFTHVKVGDILSIDEIRRDIPKMTIPYDSGEEILIVKFMVGITHNSCASLVQFLFHSVVMGRTGSRVSIVGLKSTRFEGNNRSKEADDAFLPRSRRSREWPSITFEVGVSESFTQLRQDARFWLECSGWQTRIVIVAKVDTTARTIVIERWQDGGGAQGQRQQPGRNTNVPNPYARNCFPSCIQALSLEEGQVYVGASLTIPAALIFDVLPRVQGAPFGPSDFEITAQMLNELNDTYWDGVA